MGINYSIDHNPYGFRDLIETIKESSNIHETLRSIFFKSTSLNIEDYFDDATLHCSYNSGENEYKLFFNCLDCDILHICPFCYVIGGHVGHKYNKELLNLQECKCSSVTDKHCFKHMVSKTIDFTKLFPDEKEKNINQQQQKEQHQPQTTTTTTTTTATTKTNLTINSIKNSTDLFLPNYHDYKNIINYFDDIDKSNLKKLLKIKNEIHIFIRHILIFLCDKPLRPTNKTDKLFSNYVEVLKFLNFCSRRSKFIANVVSLELLSTNIDLDLIESNIYTISSSNQNGITSSSSSSNKNNKDGEANLMISLYDIIMEEDDSKDIRSTIKFKPTEKRYGKDQYPSELTPQMGENVITSSSFSSNHQQQGDQNSNVIKPFSSDEDQEKRKDKKNNSLLILNKSYMGKFHQYFVKDLKEAHIDLFSTLIDRSKTFKVFFYRHFFNIHEDNLAPTDRYQMFMLDKFYNDEDLITLWVDKSNLIKDILFNSAKFNRGYRNFDPIRFLPDIIRTNKLAAIRLVRIDLQKFTTFLMQYENTPYSSSIESKSSEHRIRSIYFTQNIIFTFLYLFKQQTPLDLIKYFDHYLDSLSEWKTNLSSANELKHYDYYTCLPMLLSAAVIANENNYMKLQLGSWEKATKYTYLLVRFYVMSQISYFTPCKRQPTSSLAQFPLDGIEVSATINALQIFSLINFKKVLHCFFKNPTLLFSTDSISYNAYHPSAPTHLVYRFLYTILKSSRFYFDGDCLTTGIDSYEYKKVLKYHIVNLLYRGIDVPLDIGRSNSVLRNCSEKDVFDTIQEVSTPEDNPSIDTCYTQSKKMVPEYDFTTNTRIHNTMPSLMIQNTSLVNCILKQPNHLSRKIKLSHMKCVDDYYDYTNVYHLFYYGFPAQQYPLETTRLNQFDNDMGPSKGTPFNIHSSDYLKNTLREPLLYELIFRDLLFTTYDYFSISFKVAEFPSIIQRDTAKSKKLSISIDILKLISYIINHVTLFTKAELEATKRECKVLYETKLLIDIDDDIIHTQHSFKFNPSTINAVTSLIKTHSVTELPSYNKIQLSIMDLVSKALSNSKDERYPIAQSIDKVYKNLLK